MQNDTKCLVCVLFAFFPRSIIICIARNLPDLPETINSALKWMNALLLNEVQLEKTSL